MKNDSLQYSKIKKQKNCLVEKTPATSPNTSNRSSPLPFVVSDIRKKFINEISDNSNKPIGGQRWSPLIKKICLQVLFVSTTAYTLLSRFITLPCRKSIMNYASKNLITNNEYYLNTAYIKNLIDKWKKEENITNTTNMEFILSVDAIAFKPIVTINENGFVNGFIETKKLSKQQLKFVNQSWSNFENYIQQNFDKAVIKDAFVYYIQPIDMRFSCFIAHIHPSTQGKATDREVDILFEIKNIMEVSDMKISGFAFDGDTTYQKLHLNYLNKFSEDPLESNSKKFLHIISDPLHILKRARYRLVKGNVCSFIDQYSDIIDTNNYVSKFNIPQVVMSDKIFTKMHDKLPLQLFDLKNFLILYEKGDLDGMSYFLPWTLLVTSLNVKEMSLPDRISMLEVALMYLIEYNQALKNRRNELYPDRSCKSFPIVRAFHSQLTMESINTIHSLIYYLRTCNGTCSLNRVGHMSNPLQHLFGLVRMKSYNQHTFE